MYKTPTTCETTPLPSLIRTALNDIQSSPQTPQQQSPPPSSSQPQSQPQSILQMILKYFQ